MPRAVRSPSLRGLALARRPLADALELGGLRGALEDLLGGDAVAQDLAGRRHAADAGRGCGGGSRAARCRWPPRRGRPATSAANSDCGAPKPRKAPLGGVLVATARDVMRTLGTSYGPPAWIVARLRTTGESVA